MDNYRHYIRVDAQNCVVYGFSDAFESPDEGAFLLRENGGRHFVLTEGGAENPALSDEMDIWLYSWDGERVVARSEAEIARERQEKFAEMLAGEARAKRDALLDEADIVYCNAKNWPLVENPMDWHIYAQALRDVPEQEGFPENIDWPERPELRLRKAEGTE